MDLFVVFSVTLRVLTTGLERYTKTPTVFFFFHQNGLLSVLIMTEAAR